MAKNTIDLTDPRITFARVTVTLDGKEYMLKSISYGDNMSFNDVEGNSQMSLGTTDGVYKTDEGTFEFYADEFAELQEALGEKFYTTIFPASCAYEKKGNSKLTKDELIGCRFTKRGANDQSGGDGLTRSVGFKPAYIKWNGKNPLPNMPNGAK